MVKLNRKQILVTRGILKSTTSVEVEIELVGNLIVPVLVLDQADGSDTDEPLRIRFDVLPPTVLKGCPLVYEDVFYGLPDCMKITEDPVQGVRQFITAMAAVKVLLKVRFDLSDAEGTTYLKDVSVSFRKSPFILREHFQGTDLYSEKWSNYFEWRSF